MGEEVERGEVIAYEVNRVVTDYLLMTNPWYQWMRHTTGRLEQPLRPLIDNDQLSLEEGNDFA